VLLLPAVSLLVGVAIAAIGRLVTAIGRPAARMPGITRAILPVLVLAAAILYPLAREPAFFFSLIPVQASRDTYGASPFPEAIEIAAHIAADSSPEDRVAVLGSEPEIYFYARRRSATGFIYMYGLMENQPYAHTMQETAIREIEASAPRYVVVVDIVESWLAGPLSQTTILNRPRRYGCRHYPPH